MLILLVILMNVNISDLYDPQQAFLDSNYKHPLFLGGYGAGKTHTLVRKALKLASYNRGHMGAIAMPRNEDIEDVFIPAWAEMCDNYDIPYTYLEQKKRILLEFKNSPTTIIRLLHMEKPQNIVGKNLAWFGIDELDVLAYKKAKLVWDKLNGRMRAGRYRQGFVCTTPEGFKFVYRNWEQREDGKAIPFHFKTYRMKTTDNPNLPQDYIDNLHELYSEQLVQAYVNAEYVNLEGAMVWINFDRDVHVESFDVANHNLNFSGWDFGFDHPTGVIMGYYDEYQDHTYIYDEICVRHQFIGETISQYKQKQKEHKVDIRVEYCDPSGNQRSEEAPRTNIMIMRDEGLRPKWVSSFINDGVIIGNNLFDKNKITIHPRCKNLINSLEKWQRKMDSNGLSTGYEEQYKDMSDTFRYPMYNLFKKRYLKMSA